MIRPYNIADKEKLIEILRLNTPGYFHPDEEKEYIDYLDKHLEKYFVIEKIGEILGAGGINYNSSDNVSISWDLIHPDHQGKGLGMELLRYRIGLIRSDPAVNEVIVRTSQLTHIFYEKAGFKLVKKTKNYWAEGLDLYFMKMKL